MKQLTLICTLLLFAVFRLEAQQVSATADTYSLKIGEQTNITLTARPGSKEIIRWPQLSDSLGPHFDIVSRAGIDTLKDSISGQQFLKQRIRITSFDTGLFTLPVFDFTFIRPAGDSISLITDALVINVKSVPVDTTQAIKDIKNVQEVPFELAEYIPWVFAGLVVAAIIAAGIYFWLRRKKKNLPVLPSVPAIPPWEKALNALQKAGEEKLWTTGKEKAYHTAVSDTLRTYIEEQFQLPALESTTGDILRMCARHPVISEQESVLRQILQAADLVKFAKLSLTAAEHEQSLVQAIRFVNETKPAPQRKEEPRV
jgi:hypothetical protein